MKVITYIRSFIFAVLYLPFLIVASSFGLTLNLIFRSKTIDDFICEKWARMSCWFFGVRVYVKGFENIPAGGCIYLFNHTSHFDIFAVQGYVDKRLRFGAKIELFKIPAFGAVMRRFGVLPIDRSKREDVYRIYNEASHRIASGERFALAPEGTRQLEEKLGNFKTGPFIFAIQAHALMVPVVIRGASSILPKGQFLPNAKNWTSDIYIQILPAIPTEGLQLGDRQALQLKTREIMANVFDLPKMV